MSSIKTQAIGSRPRFRTVTMKAIVWPASASVRLQSRDRREIGDPRPGEESADQHQAQQGQHGTREHAQVEDDRDDQDPTMPKNQRIRP